MAVMNYLDLATAHISRETMSILESAVLPSSWPAMTISPYDYGVFLGITEDADEQDVNLPPDLLGVVRHARGLGCTVIRLDSHAEEVDLPTHSW